MAAISNDISDDGSNEKILDVGELYSRIIRKHILELLNVIHTKYPDKFPKTAITTELENIFSNINFVAIVSRQSRPGNSSSKGNTTIQPARKSRPSRPSIKLDPSIRCQARIWDDIFDRETCKQVAAIDDEFQVSDYNDINIKRFAKKYILGKQCARKKTTGTDYCLLHNRHCPHGNYLEPPTKELCFHFMTDGGYIDNNPHSDTE